MKSIYTLLVLSILTFSTLSFVNADSDTNSGTNNLSGTTTASGQYKNRGQMIKYAQERLKQTREALKQKRDNMRNGRTHSGVTQLGVTADQLLCVRTAIAKREATILTAFNTFSASTSSGYTIRTMALNTAWTLTGTTDRKIAINAAWANWSSSMQIVNEVDKASLRGAWDTFKTEAQVCKVPEALTEGNRMSHEVGMGMRNN